MKKNFLLVISIIIMASIMLCGCAGSFSHDEECWSCGSGPTKEYRSDDGLCSYVCEECASECMFCGDENPDKYYFNGFGEVMVVCDSCYDEVTGEYENEYSDYSDDEYDYDEYDEQVITACISDHVTGHLGCKAHDITNNETYTLNDMNYNKEWCAITRSGFNSDCANIYYIYRKASNGEPVSNDGNVAVFGWFGRIINFEHEWACDDSEFFKAMKDEYPDCSDLKLIDKSELKYAPDYVEDQLGYIDFTASFDNMSDTNVRLYFEYDDEAPYHFSEDSWAMLCLPNEF